MDKTSFAAIELLSEKGIEQAIILMAQMHAYGIGCERSIDEAISLLNKVKVSSHPYYYYFAAQLLLEEYSEEERKTIFLFLRLCQGTRKGNDDLCVRRFCASKS